MTIFISTTNYFGRGERETGEGERRWYEKRKQNGRVTGKKADRWGR